MFFFLFAIAKSSLLIFYRPKSLEVCNAAWLIFLSAVSVEEGQVVNLNLSLTGFINIFILDNLSRNTSHHSIRLNIAYYYCTCTDETVLA